METTKGQRLAIVFLLALAVGTVVWFTSADDAEPSHAPPNVPSTVQVDDRRQEGAEPRDARPAVAESDRVLEAVDDEPASVEDPGSDAYSEDRRPGGRLRQLRARREERRALRRLDAGVSR